MAVTKCNANFPSKLLEMIKRRVEQENLSSISEYIRNIVMEERLSPETYLIYRRESNPSFDLPDRSHNNERYCLLGIDEYIDNTDLSVTEKLHFSMPEEMLKWLDETATEHKLTRTRLLIILMMKDLAHGEAYFNYRSIFDKPWLHKCFREVMHCVHDDDPDQSTNTIPDEIKTWEIV